MRLYKGCTLCSSCYIIPEIKSQNQNIWKMVYSHLVSTGKWYGGLCESCLISTDNITQIKVFELDPINPFDKVDSVNRL